MTVDHHPFEATLLAYASGHLPEGLSLVVATHLAWCAGCRDAVAAAETAAGLLLAKWLVAGLMWPRRRAEGR